MTYAMKCLAFFVITLLVLTSITGCGEPKQTEPAKVLFSQAQELQQAEKYNDAIKTYKQIAAKYKESRLAANSQFMIGYIYANHLKDMEQAKIEFTRFLDNYSESADSGLIVGAKFELEYLGKSIEEIPILSSVGESDTTAFNEEATDKK
ncbi:MAG: tetratricopeptide repeat protein [Calditrichaeota bacterium]|nr:tetratricopeptide repeat protein [Calditrichota bacterium]